MDKMKQEVVSKISFSTGKLIFRSNTDRKSKINNANLPQNNYATGQYRVKNPWMWTSRAK